MGIDFDPLAGLKTDDLKNQLSILREDLVSRQSSYAEQMIALDAAMNDIKKMEEKATFVVAQLDQIAVLTTPPPPSDAEIASDALDRYFTDPIFLASAGIGGIGGVAMMVGGLAPPVMKLIGKAPKLGKATKLAKSSKFMKVLRFGKGAVALSAAIAVIELVVGMASAQAINKQLKKDKAVLNKHIDEADAEIAELQSATREAEGLVKSLLADSELGDLEHDAAIAAYVRMMNEAIAGLSAQKAKIRMVRKMVLHGTMERADIAAMTDVEESVVERIEKRVRVERALVEGRSVVEAARETGLAAQQVVEIEGVVRARNEAVAVEDAEQVAEILNVPVAVVLGEGEATLPLLAPSWADIEADGDLDAIGRKAVLSADALARLRTELRSKAALAGGGSPDDVAASSGRPIEDIAEWGIDVAEGRADVAILRRDGKLGKPSLVAAQMRLPLSLVA